MTGSPTSRDAAWVCVVNGPGDWGAMILAEHPTAAGAKEAVEQLFNGPAGTPGLPGGPYTVTDVMPLSEWEAGN